MSWGTGSEREKTRSSQAGASRFRPADCEGGSTASPPATPRASAPRSACSRRGKGLSPGNSSATVAFPSVVRTASLHTFPWPLCSARGGVDSAGRHPRPSAPHLTLACLSLHHTPLGGPRGARGAAPALIPAVPLGGPFLTSSSVVLVPVPSPSRLWLCVVGEEFRVGVGSPALTPAPNTFSFCHRG